MNQTGFVAIALAGLWIAYLVPHRLRYRQQLLDSCVEDRFSGDLRVLRVAGRAGSTAHDGRGGQDAARYDAVRSTGWIHPVRSSIAGRPGSLSPVPSVEAGPGRERGGRTMDRPHAGRDRTVADAARHTASEHAARAAHLARRAAAARRRAALTGVLLLAVVAGWGAVAVGSLGTAAGVVPSVLLGGVLVLGRRAVIAGARADARWAAGEGSRPPVADAVRSARSARSASAAGRPTVVGRAVHPSDATTEVMARVGERREVPAAASSAAVRAEPEVVGSSHAVAEPGGVGAAPQSAEPAGVTAEAVGDRTGPTGSDAEGTSSTWVPVPVPRPAYTLKPMARRPEPAPLVLDTDPATDRSVGAATSPADGSTAARPSDAGVAADDVAPTTGGLSLDAILARRRAAGE